MCDRNSGTGADNSVVKPERICSSTSRSTLDLTKLNASPTCLASECHQNSSNKKSDEVTLLSIESKGKQKKVETTTESSSSNAPQGMQKRDRHSDPSVYQLPKPSPPSLQPRPVSAQQNIKASTTTSFIPMMNFDGEDDEAVDLTPIPVVYGYGHHHPGAGGLPDEYTVPTFKDERTQGVSDHDMVVSTKAPQGAAAQSSMPMPRAASQQSQSESSTQSQTSRIVSANSFNCASNQSLASAASHGSQGHNMFAPLTTSSSVAMQESCKNGNKLSTRPESRNACATPCDHVSFTQSTTPIQLPKTHDHDHANIHFSDHGFGNIPRSATPSSLTSAHYQPTFQRGTTTVSKSSSSHGFERPAPGSPHPLSQLRSPASSVANELNGLSLANRNASAASLYSVNSTSSLVSMPSFSHGTALERGCDALAMDHKRHRERNRASARQSRRRRKHYLDVLEERVKELSESMDAGRRQHVACAVRAIRDGRRACLQMAERDLFSFCATPEFEHGREVVQCKLEFHFRILQARWNRMSADNLLVFEFCKEQLKSLILPPHYKLLLWLTLQNEPFFRGGRSSAERLSAARIGEKLLYSGHREAAPNQGMWPLTCNEIGLSYEQEDRFRRLQRNVLADPGSWLTRHSAEATNQVLKKICSTSQRVALKVRAREDVLLKILSPEQRIRYLNWAQRRLDVTKRIVKEQTPSTWENTAISFKNASHDHRAAHMYTLARRLDIASGPLPAWQEMAPPSELKKLSRRPMFETLVNRTAAMNNMDNRDCDVDQSSTTTGSNKKTKLSAEGKDGHDIACGHLTTLEKQQIIPERYQFQSSSHVASILGPIGVPLRFQQPPQDVSCETATKKAEDSHNSNPTLQCTASPDNVLLGPPGNSAGRDILHSPIMNSCPVPMMILSNMNTNIIKPKPQPVPSFSSPVRKAPVKQNLSGPVQFLVTGNNNSTFAGAKPVLRSSVEESPGAICERKEGEHLPLGNKVYAPQSISCMPVTSKPSSVNTHGPVKAQQKSPRTLEASSATSCPKRAHEGWQIAANHEESFASKSLYKATRGSQERLSNSTNAPTVHASAFAPPMAAHNREVSLLNSPLPTAHDDFMMAVIATSNPDVCSRQNQETSSVDQNLNGQLAHQGSYPPTEHQYYQHHVRLSSQAQTDAFLMELADDDGWAVGDGYDMDIDP